MHFSLSSQFSSGMILQRRQRCCIYGSAAQGTKIQAEFLGKEYYATADDKNRWQILLESCEAGGPHTLHIEAEEQSVDIEDILIGDVWLLGGQSNMELKMQRVSLMFADEADYAEKTPAPIRCFSVEIYSDLHNTYDMLNSGEWTKLSRDGLFEFSAIGYFFARYYYEKTGVPVGLIQTAVGGTPVAAWLPEEALTAFESDAAEVKKWKSAPQEQFAIEAEEQKRNDEYYRGFDAADIGLKENWQAANFDDCGWSERVLDEPFDEEMEQTGSIWFRKSFDVPDDLAGKPASIFLGTITDADTVYVNGEEIGQTTYCYPPRVYTIPAMPKKRITIAIRFMHHFQPNPGFTRGKLRAISCGGRTFNLNCVWKYKRASLTAPFIPETRFSNKPTGFYNTMIAPLVGTKIAGVLWYQGESDTRAAANYGEKFIQLIKSWRACFGQDIPFIFSQLAYYIDNFENAENCWQLLRNEQEKALCLPATAMVWAHDAGEYNDLHPLNKQLIGKRLAHAALGLYCGLDMPASPYQLGPMY